jgi:hypothetical protein
MENDFFKIIKENGIATIWLDFKKRENEHCLTTSY